jgi:hypothetical protein
VKKLLSFAEAQLAGEAMFDRWEHESRKPPPFSKDDAAWSDLARVAWEAVQKHRLTTDA